jgi:hypothetical protein
MGMQTKRHARKAERRLRGAESSIKGDAREMNGPDPIPAITRKKSRIGKEDANAVPMLPIVASVMPTPTRRRAFILLLRCADAGAESASPIYTRVEKHRLERM